MLFKYIKNWKLKQTNFVCLNEKETKFKRLNRNTFDINNIETIILNNMDIIQGEWIYVDTNGWVLTKEELNL